MFGASLLRLRSDDQLVAMFRAGHDEAFRVIHDRYRQRLFAYTRQMLPSSRQDAEDALQDVFVKAYAGLRANDRELALRAWLYKIAHNRCVDQLRRPAPAVPLAEAPGTRSADPALVAEQRERLAALVVDVQRLPEQQRSALLMRELGGMSYGDLAAALGLSVPAVKSLLVRARVGLTLAAEARDAACVEIRRQLVECHDRGVRATGAARRHLRDCESCREFRRDVRTLSRRFSALVPAFGPVAMSMKLLGGGASSGSAAVGGGTGGAIAAAGGGAAIGGGAALGGGAAITGGALTTGHIAALLATAIVAAGGAVALHPVAGGHQTHVPRYRAHPAMAIRRPVRERARHTPGGNSVRAAPMRAARRSRATVAAAPAAASESAPPGTTLSEYTGPGSHLAAQGFFGGSAAATLGGRPSIPHTAGSTAGTGARTVTPTCPAATPAGSSSTAVPVSAPVAGPQSVGESGSSAPVSSAASNTTTTTTTTTSSTSTVAQAQATACAPASGATAAGGVVSTSPSAGAAPASAGTTSTQSGQPIAGSSAAAGAPGLTGTSGTASSSTG